MTEDIFGIKIDLRAKESYIIHVNWWVQSIPPSSRNLEEEAKQKSETKVVTRQLKEEKKRQIKEERKQQIDHKIYESDSDDIDEDKVLEAVKQNYNKYNDEVFACSSLDLGTDNDE